MSGVIPKDTDRPNNVRTHAHDLLGLYNKEKCSMLVCDLV